MVLFLLNDCMLELEARTLATPRSQPTVHLSAADAIVVAKEAFAAEPDLPRKALLRAQKVGLMLMLKQPEINAALFIAPSYTAASRMWLSASPRWRPRPCTR